MFAIGNNELDELPLIGTTVICNVCGQLHEVKYGQKIMPDETREDDNTLAYINCPENEKSYLVAVMGRDITQRFQK
jgi:hypothetical protein